MGPRTWSILAIAAIVTGTTGLAAPSGGPYGPIAQSYAIPKAPHVYYVAPDGDAKAPGTVLANPTTLEAAVAKAVSGDAVILRGGVYRTGSIEFNQKIIFQPYGTEQPVLKGTEVATKWQAAGPGVWKTTWTKLFPAAPLAWWNRAKEEAATPLHRFNNDMVFVDGAFLQSAGSPAEVTPKTYYIDYAAKEVYVGADPASHLIEITAHDGALIRTARPVNGKLNDHKGPIIRGLTVTGYARRCLEIEGKKTFGPNDEPTDEPIGLTDPKEFGKEATGSVLENLTVSYCSRVGGWFRGDNMVIRNSLFTDTSTEGIYVIGSANVLIEKNIVRRNNIEQLTGYYPGAVKIFNQTRRVVFRDNLVLENPYSNGVWYDVGNIDGVFVNNYVEGALVGFFFEISKGATVAGNVFVRNGRGVWALNSSGVRVYNNTFLDNPATFARDGRSAKDDHFGWHPSTGPDVEERTGHMLVNNLIVSTDGYRDPLVRIEQNPALCDRLTTSPLARFDGNVYVRAFASTAPLALVSPVAPENQTNGAGLKLFFAPPADGKTCTAAPATLGALKQVYAPAETKGRRIDGNAASVFLSPEMMRYELRLPLAAALPTPPDVLKEMGWKSGGTVGAYPARPAVKKKK